MHLFGSCYTDIVVIIIIHIYAGYLQLYAWRKHVRRAHGLAAILWLQCVIHVMLLLMLNVLFFRITTFRSNCPVSSIVIFFSSLMSLFTGVLMSCLLNVFGMVPIAPMVLVYIVILFLDSTCAGVYLLLLLLLLSSSSSSSSPPPPSSLSSSSPLCRVFIIIFLRQNMSLGNTVLQLFCCYYSRCLYR